jgi:hypothetical protein
MRSVPVFKDTNMSNAFDCLQIRLNALFMRFCMQIFNFNAFRELQPRSTSDEKLNKRLTILDVYKSSL